ncbi:hypothetical protein AAVH_37963 [Aphelenchoides avenae]|nr:hypothetical protein AAVH_37963 [Aphelenchus avenae]
MIRACVLLMAFLCLTVVRCAAIWCSDEEVPNKTGDHCYRTSGSSPWDLSKYTLASIPAADYLDIRALARIHFKFAQNTGDSDNFWLAGRAIGGKWMWLSFDAAWNDMWSPMKYTNWENGRAPPAKDGLCLAVNTITLKWLALSCKSRLAPIVGDW